MKINKYIASAIFVWAGLSWVSGFSQNLIAQKKTLKLMGTAFEFTAVAKTDTLAWEAINAGIAEVKRVESVISEWDPASEVSEVNRNAGIRPVKVSRELFNLIRRSAKISEVTGGAFDITWAALDGIWKFDGSMKELPQQSRIDSAKTRVGYRKIVLNEDSLTVFLPLRGMKMGFGGIGQGYGVMQAVALMKKMGIESGVVNGSGDIYAWGTQPDGHPWKVSIADPADPGTAIAWLEVKDMAVVTTGNYFKFVEFNGVRYSHLINPVTGWPAQGLLSVTVLSPDAEISDGLDTGLFILGREEGMKVANQLKGVSCIMITDSHELITSDGLQINPCKTTPLPEGQTAIPAK